MMHRYILPLLAIIGLGVALAMVVRGNRAVPSAQRVVQPANAPFTSYISGAGIVEASTENIAIGTAASGIVTAIYVKWGDRVNKGAPLFKVDTRDLEAQLPPATAKVKEAEATLAKAENRLKTGEGLEPGVSISVEEMANRRYDVAIDEAAVASAKAQVEQIQRQIELRTIRAPISGRILQMKTRLGEYAQSGVLSAPLMLLGDDTRLHVRVDIDENDAWRFQPCAAVASVRGNPEIKTPLHYVRTDPDVIPKLTLTGDSTQRTDTRVLQVIYSFDPASLPLYVGQLMDVFIEAAPTGGKMSRPGDRASPCGEPASGNRKAQTLNKGRP